MSYHYMDDVTTAFQQLSLLPERETVAAHMNTIEQFVVAAFAPHATAGFAKDINQTQFQMSSDLISGSLRDLSPSRRALEMHHACTTKCFPKRLGVGQYHLSSDSSTRCRIGMEP